MSKLFMASLVWLLWIAALTCYSVPTVSTSDTTAEQARLRDAAQDLAEIPDRPENRIVPQDKAAIRSAAGSLDLCANTLARKDSEINACAAHLSECGKQFEAKAERLRQCESETGFLSSLGLRARWFFFGVIAAIIAAVVLHFTGSLAAILARFRPGV